MKSFCTTGLILLVSLGWAVSTALAQNNEYAAPTLLPLPDAAPVLQEPPIGNTSSNAAEPFGSAFTGSKQQEPQAEAAAADPAPQASTAPAGKTDESVSTSLWDDCGCNSCGGGRWFVNVGALAMTRNRANPYWTTFQTNNNPNQLMNTQNAGAGWAGGGQVTLGYDFGCYSGGSCGSSGSCGECNECGSCGCVGPAIAFTYWGLTPMNGFSSVTDQTNNVNTALSTPIDVGGVTISGQPAGDFFDNAHEQRIWRSDRVDNFEVNLLQAGLLDTGRLQVTALAGFRYFRFSESLTYGSVRFGSNFGDNNGADEAYLGIRCVNNLYGGQIGAAFNYAVTDRFGLFFVPKVGIFGNSMDTQTLLYSGDQVNNPTYNISGHKTDISFLGELDSGINWACTDNLRLYLGYRVIGVANLALADNQFLPFLADTQGFSEVKQSGALILHGAMAGVTWSF